MTLSAPASRDRKRILVRLKGLVAALEAGDEPRASAGLEQLQRRHRQGLAGRLQGAIQRDTEAPRGILTRLAQAQECHDLAGQVVRLVMALVRGVESALLELLRAAGGGPAALQDPPRRPISGLRGAAMPNGPAPASQADADALLASLGF